MTVAMDVSSHAKSALKAPSRSSQSSSSKSSQPSTDRSTNTATTTKSKFSVEIEFTNDLPSVPAFPKLMKSPFVGKIAREVVNYNGESIEAIRGVPILTDRYTAMPVTMVDTPRYMWPLIAGAKTLDPADYFLLSTDAVDEQRSHNTFHVILPSEPDAVRCTVSSANASSAANAALASDASSAAPAIRSAQVNFLYKPEYSEDKVLAFTQLSQIRKEGAKRAAERKTDVDPLPAHYSIPPQERIEQSFTAVRRAPVHPTDPTLRPTEILPLIPDLQIIYAPTNVTGRVKTSYSRAAASAAMRARQASSLHPSSQTALQHKKTKRPRDEFDDAISDDSFDDEDSSHEKSGSEEDAEEIADDGSFTRVYTVLTEMSRTDDVVTPMLQTYGGPEALSDAEKVQLGTKLMLLRHTDKIPDSDNTLMGVGGLVGGLGPNRTIRRSKPNVATSFGLYFPAQTTAQRKRAKLPADVLDDDDDPLDEDTEPIRDDEAVYVWNKELIMAPSVRQMPDDNFFIIRNNGGGASAVPYVRYGRFDNRLTLKKRVSSQVDSCARLLRHRPNLLAVTEVAPDELEETNTKSDLHERDDA